MPAAANGGRRLEADHVDFEKLQEIFASEHFQTTALEHLNDPALHESLATNMEAGAPKKARYHDVIIEMHIEMPEELEDDLMAVLNHGGLSAENSEAVALLLVHAPLSENPHIANHLGFADKPELLREVTEGRQGGSLPLQKFFGISADGRRLQSSAGTTQSTNAGPSTQLVVMGFMNKILGALTSDFQHALNNTGFFTLE